MERAQAQRNGHRHIGQGGDGYIGPELTVIDEEEELDNLTERYVGPSAITIARLIPHSVRYERGWFWTTTEICHGGTSQDLAFRQRPDGNGIDVRCHTRGCPRHVAIAGLQMATGAYIGRAYVPLARAGRLSWFRDWPWQRTAWHGAAALAVALPLLLGLGVQAAALNFTGYSVGSVLMSLWMESRPTR